MSLETLTNEVVSIVKQTGVFLKEEARKISAADVEEKSLNSLVTYVDKEAEKQLVSALGKALPDAGFHAEEDHSLLRKERYNWIIDPLDGTTNYIHGLPVYSISVALADYDEIILGVVCDPEREDCFYTWKESPSFLNGNTISVSKTKQLRNALLATGFPYHDYSIMDQYLSLFDELMRSARGIRRLGSAAIDLAYVACGKFEVFYEYGLNAWDVAAGALLVKNAGGTVSDFAGGDDFIAKREIVASNNYTYHEFMQKLMRHFGQME
jgi:myo-inositol-1(or 4)-monophosphatase